MITVDMCGTTRDFSTRESNKHGRLVGTNETAPTSALTLKPGPDQNDCRGVEVAVNHSIQSRKEIALDYLARAVRDRWTTPELLAERVKLAAEYGCTTFEILAVCGDA